MPGAGRIGDRLPDRLSQAVLLLLREVADGFKAPIHIGDKLVARLVNRDRRVYHIRQASPTRCKASSSASRFGMIPPSRRAMRTPTGNMLDRRKPRQSESV